MAAKLILLLALAAVAQCSLDHAAVVEPVARADDVTSFSYDVADPYTGDFKSQSETRVGGAVQGQYSLLDADGTRRTVDYAADDLNGFNAVVRKDAVGLAAARTIAAPTLARTVAAPFVAPNVVTGGVDSRAFAAPSVYAASAPLVSGTVLKGAHLVNNIATPVFGTGFAPTVLGASNLLSARTIAAPTVFTGAAPLIAPRTLTNSVVNTGLYSGALTAPLLSSSLINRNSFNSGVYAASAPLVTGGLATVGHGILAKQTLATPVGGFFGGRLVSSAPLVAGGLVGDRLVSGSLVTGGLVGNRLVSSSGPLVTGGLVGDRLLSSSLVSGGLVGGRLILPHNTFSGRLVTDDLLPTVSHL